MSFYAMRLASIVGISRCTYTFLTQNLGSVNVY